MSEGVITIKLEGASFQQSERCRQIIHTMFEQGVFSLKNGNAILNFDPDGNLNSIEFNIKKWRRGSYDSPLVKIPNNVKIELVK